MKARKMHRCISLILAFAMIFSGIYVYAEEKSDNIASVKFGKNVAMNNISGVAMGQTNSPNLMERDGVEAWGLLPQRYLGSAYLYVDVDDRFAHNVSDGSVFEIQVTYYSQGNGYFQLFYDAQRNPKRHHNELIFIGDEMKWKTVTFTLDDVYFGDRLDESYLGGAYTGTGKHDLALTIRTRNDQEASPSDVLISEIKVIKYPAANPVTFYSSIDESGSAFPWYQKEKIITNHFENTTDEVVEADVTYTAITTSGYKVWEKQDKLTLNPKEKKDVDINIETDYCDKYNYYVDIKSEKNKIDSHFKGYGFVILKTDPNGIKNEEYYYATHIYNGPWWSNPCEDIEKAVHVLAKGNNGGIRSSMPVTDLVMGSSPTYDRNGTIGWPDRYEELTNLLRKYDVDLISLLVGTRDDGVAETEEEWQDWEKYLDIIVDKTKDIVTYYEIWNEPQLTVAWNKQTYKSYVDFNNRTYEMLKERCDNPVAVIGVCALMDPTSYKFMDEVLSYDIEQYGDALTLHPYTTTAPEKQDIIGLMKWYIDRFNEEKGVEVPVISTEAGYPVNKDYSKTRKEQAEWDTRAALLMKGEEVHDVFTNYSFEMTGLQDTFTSAAFGVVTMGTKYELDKYGNYYLPFESYIASTALNYLVADSESRGRLTSDDNKYIYRLKSNKFNKDVLPMWTINENEQVTLNLGAKDIEYYDINGNMTPLHSDDGKYTFLLTEKPFYVMGDFAENITIEETQKAKYSILGGKMVKGDIIDITIDSGVAGCTTEAELPDGFTVTERKKAGETAERLKIKAEKSYDEKIYINFTVKDEAGRNVNHIEFPVEFFDVPYTSETSGLTFDSADIKKWSCDIDIENYSTSRALNGTLTVKSLGDKEINQSYKLGFIPKSSTGAINVEFPRLDRFGKYSIEYSIMSTDGIKYDFTSNLNIFLMQKAKGEIKIDGELGADEWDREASLICDEENSVYKLTAWDWFGPEDKSASTMLKWDEENLYIAAEVTDDKYNMEEPAATSYRGDNIQFGVYINDGRHVPYGTAGTTFEEIGLTITDGKPEVYRYMSREGKTQVGLVTENVELATNQAGAKTVYEFRITWKELLGEEYVPQAGHEIGFSILFNENDGTGRKGWIEFGSGIGKSKDANQFAYINLTDN
ncbi:MAG: sugar-binding protein [Clostridia bacterium]|nr:sugar-binding protein [Clostridia bacterium]